MDLSKWEIIRRKRNGRWIASYFLREREMMIGTTIMVQIQMQSQFLK
jgi:hypothetical protein